MLKQNIKGVVFSVNANGSAADLTALTGIMAGEITQFDLKTTGGSTLNTMPDVLNKKVFIVGRRADSSTGRLSTQVSIPHIKSSVTFNEISAAVINKFNPDYTSDLKADYVTLKFDK